MTLTPESAAEHAIRSRYTITGPDVDRRIAYVMGDVRVALNAAAPLIAAAERDRIRQQLKERGDEIMRTGKGCGADAEELWQFAAMLGDRP